jgi:hypothetical protein
VSLHLSLDEGHGPEAGHQHVGTAYLYVEDADALYDECADPVPRQQRRDAIRAAGGLSHLGALLGRLHTLDTTAAASAGGLGVGDGVPPPHPPRLVGVHGTDNADGGHDGRVGDEGPDRDDRDPGPRGGHGPLISRWSPNVTLMARAGHDHGVCSAP